MKPSFWLAKEEEVFIPGSSGKIQAGVSRHEGTNKGLLVCHPHPLHQGTMFNKVVTTVIQAARKNNLTAVRFNYRGVGDSQGIYDHAIGEAQDALSVGRWMLQELGCKQVELVGFSFGACVAFNIQNDLPGSQCIMLCPSVAGMRFNADGGRQSTVIQAENDEIVDVSAVQAWVKRHKNIQLKYIAGASHFFHGQLLPLQNMLIELISDA